MEKKDVEMMSGKTDERRQGNWESRYIDKVARRKQVIEASYIFFIVILSFVALLFNYVGLFDKWFCIPDEKQLFFSRITTCSLCGLLGGAIFDMKWFYKAIAHGFWNVDRVYWRIFTPVISLSFAFCLSCIFSDNIVVHGDGFSAATLGFLAGYFSDEAVGKMAEVAKVLFNTDTKFVKNDKSIDDEEENK